MYHNSNFYNAEMAFRQVALHMIRHPQKFYPYVEHDLLETGESYESYCYNIFHGNIWGDDLVAAAFGDMWNVPISIISPLVSKPINLFHNVSEPDIVIVANGGSWMAPDKKSRTTHFNGSRCTLPDFSKPGSRYFNPTLAQDAMPGLKPIILDNAEKAKEVAIKEYTRDAKEKGLGMIRGLCREIDYLNNRVCEVIKEADNLMEMKHEIENRFKESGIEVEKITEAGKTKPREYVRTEEREKSDLEKDRKRKREIEEKEKEHESRSKKTKLLLIGPSGEKMENVEEDVPDDENKTHDQKLTEQQSQIIREYEEIMQKQQEEINRQAGEISKWEQYKKNIQVHAEKQKVEKERVKTEKGVETTKQTLSQPIAIPASTRSIPITSHFKPVATPTTTSKKPPKGSVESLLSPHALKHLKALNIKKEPESTGYDFGGVIIVDDPTEEAKPQFTTTDETPATVPESKKEGIIITPVTPESATIEKGVSSAVFKSTGLRSGLTRPVPDKLKSDGRFYCKNCKSHYSRRDELLNHEKNNCMKEEREFVCPACPAGYYSEMSIREHYYKIHLNKHLHFCTKCGEGFFHKSGKSTHMSQKCPQKDGPKKYKGRLDYDPELEKFFKRRVRIPVAENQQVSEEGEVAETVQETPTDNLETGKPVEVFETSQVKAEGSGENVQDLLESMSEGFINVEGGDKMVSGYLNAEQEVQFQRENIIEEIVKEQNVSRDDAVVLVENLLDTDDDGEDSQ